MTSSTQASVSGTTQELDISNAMNVTSTYTTDVDSRHVGKYKQKRPEMTPDIGDHVTTRAFRCTACERQFASRKYLSMHMALHKMAAEPLPPPPMPPVAAVLGGELAGGEATTLQIRHPRTGSVCQQWSCPVCGKTFAQNSNFRNHVRTHSDERPYVCLVCLIGFKERYHLKKHTLFKHSPGQLNEACRQCGKRFKDLTAVRAHERTHSDARPYSCSRCDKTFKTSECLWHHENRSKSCGRTTSVSGGGGGRLGSPQRNLQPAGLLQPSFRRRQRRNRVTSHETTLPTTSGAAPSSASEAAAAVATLLAHFVESSSPQNGEAAAPSPPNEVTCDVQNAASFGTQSDSVIAELFDCDISDLWTSSLTSDGVASFYNDDVDINLCAPTNCFDDLMVTTSKPNNGVSTEGLNEPGQQLWNGATPTYLPCHGDRRLQPSFASYSNDAAFKTSFSHSERQLVYDQSISDFPIQQNQTVCAYDDRSTSSGSSVAGTYDGVRSLKPSPTCCRALLEPSCSGGSALSGSCLPTAVVAPIKRDRQHELPPDYDVSLPSPLSKTFHLPPIETFAPRRRPRRPAASTCSWPASYQYDVGHRDLLRRPQQQCPTVARYLMTSAGARNPITHINKSEGLGIQQFTCWQ